MVQHAAAIDVVELAEPEPRQVEQRLAAEADIREAPGLGARGGDRQRLRGAVEAQHVAGTSGGGQLLGQHDRAVAGAAAGDERVQRPRPRSGRAEHPVVDLAQVARAADDQAPRLLARIARRIGIGLVLRREQLVGVVSHAA